MNIKLLTHKVTRTVRTHVSMLPTAYTCVIPRAIPYHFLHDCLRKSRRPVFFPTVIAPHGELSDVFDWEPCYAAGWMGGESSRTAVLIKLFLLFLVSAYLVFVLLCWLLARTRYLQLVAVVPSKRS
jgi:hypothetical protein